MNAQTMKVLGVPVLTDTMLDMFADKVIEAERQRDHWQDQADVADKRVAQCLALGDVTSREFDEARSDRAWAMERSHVQSMVLNTLYGVYQGMFYQAERVTDAIIVKVGREEAEAWGYLLAEEVTAPEAAAI